MSLRTCPEHGVYVADTSTDFGKTWCPDCGPRPTIVSDVNCNACGGAYGKHFQGCAAVGGEQE